ncbi:hypothetical protein CLV59_111110 [Chitinophaga dinghuensis]|uniref:Uncharacterized protein n=1 Tax=Chitinophaga dinghuensis TaxID=1539050 RepID=A0A327VMA3_9BACT|nr:hypothetical protein CLV59_111110 [Chitinophaga dinghuensis]
MKKVKEKSAKKMLFVEKMPQIAAGCVIGCMFSRFF